MSTTMKTMRLASRFSRCALSIAIVCLIAGCGGGGDDGGAGVDAGNGNGNGSGEAVSGVSYVAELTLPGISGGEATCCKDFGDLSKAKIEDDQDVVDNAFAHLADALESLGFLDFEFQESIDGQLEEGRLVILFEHSSLGGESGTFRLDGFFGAFAGATTYEDASDGQGSFTVGAESYDGSGNPLIRFDDAAIRDGSLGAGPAVVGASFPVADGAIALQLHGTEITGDVTESAEGVTYANGTIAGYLLLEDLFGAMNDFLNSDACACLGLDGRDVFIDDNGEWSSECVDADAHTCEEDSGCANLAVGGAFSICQSLPPILESEADIRTDPESSAYQGFSIGYEFAGVPGEIVD